MGSMPYSTYKPPSFRMVETIFNENPAGLQKRVDAFVRLVTQESSLDASNIVGPDVKVVPNQNNALFDHFTKHWLGKGAPPALGGPSPFWPWAAKHQDVIVERIATAFRRAMAALLERIPGGYRRLHLLWVCASPNPADEVFGVRTHVEACDVTVIFLTPIPIGVGNLGKWRRIPSGAGQGASGPNLDQKLREHWEDDVARATLADPGSGESEQTYEDWIDDGGWIDDLPEIASELGIPVRGLEPDDEEPEAHCCFDVEEDLTWPVVKDEDGKTIDWPAKVVEVRQENDDAVYGSIYVPPDPIA